MSFGTLGLLAIVAHWDNGDLQAAGPQPVTVTAPVDASLPVGQGTTVDSQKMIASGALAGGSPGNQLVEAARTALLTWESIAARVRFRVRFAGSDLAGSGIYLQLGPEEARRFRWELRMQVAGTTSTLVQVSDGRFLWTDRLLPSGPTVSRIDLRRIREALGAKSASQDRRLSGSMLPMLATDPLHGGGLPRLLALLGDAYTFGSPRQSDLLGVPVYSVEGTWLAKGRGQETGGERSEAENREQGVEAERHIPLRVQLTLGRDDLFPYRLTYSAIPDITDAGVSTDADSDNGSALRIEWYDVQLNGPVDARRFHYSPSAESNWKDVTEDMLSSSMQ